ncbi:phosphorylase family protein [Cellulomonas bogoriensis]|uniref:Uridine phosphorylase n=1 Tax=Cellulomonas bogoriensis 69B4 = DSM 16987 TaxID=1386082 RepID=A0A0A0BQ08_9CELL|nr:purine-nucleoside phosphorylase [Cellulomonas bogoriensis]KGM09717.1 purine nucleoside phosphorylase [Cellulomonas bogoriensis 69B4 = DSM 16987]
MPTPHIDAEPEDLAPDVLMPGDPRRATRIAETVLEDAKLVTEVRGIVGYTGTFDGRPVSVLASGMGMPSMAIYATELFRFFGARRVIRIGTAGGMAPQLKVGDVVIASAAHTDSAMTTGLVPGVTLSHAPNYALLSAAATAAGVGPHQSATTQRPGASPVGDETRQVSQQRRRRRARSGAVHVGPVFTSDLFYAERQGTIDALVRHGTLAVEMEAAALYATAAAEGGQALAVCTISDLLFSEESLTAGQRESLFDRSVALALAAFATG